MRSNRVTAVTDQLLFSLFLCSTVSMKVFDGGGSLCRHFGTKQYISKSRPLSGTSYPVFYFVIEKLGFKPTNSGLRGKCINHFGLSILKRSMTK